MYAIMYAPFTTRHNTHFNAFVVLSAKISNRVFLFTHL